MKNSSSVLLAVGIRVLLLVLVVAGILLLIVAPALGDFGIAVSGIAGAIFLLSLLPQNLLKKMPGKAQ